MPDRSIDSATPAVERASDAVRIEADVIAGPADAAAGMILDAGAVNMAGGGNGPLSGSSNFFGYDLQAAVDLVEKGGPVVVILVLLSVLATTAILVKLVQFLLVRTGRVRGTEEVLEAWFAGSHARALQRATASRQPAMIVLTHAMRGRLNGAPDALVREDVERIAAGELAGLRSHLRLLEITVQTAPLLGLFGTVIGMISAFQALQGAGADADPTVLAGGIWVALLTTAVGLAVAIPVAFILAWFEGRIERETQIIENAVTSLFTARATEAKVTLLDREPRLAHAAE